MAAKKSKALGSRVAKSLERRLRILPSSWVRDVYWESEESFLRVRSRRVFFMREVRMVT